MRRLVILLVALILISVVAVYFVAASNALPTDRTTISTLAGYQGGSTFGYRATLSPNPIYHQPTLGPGQGTLFLSLVRTIDFSYTYRLAMTAPVDMRLGLSTRISLVAPVLNLTVNSSVQPFVDMAASSSVTLQASMTLSMPSTVQLLRNITNATGYTFTTFTIRYSAQVFDTLSAGSETVLRTDAPSYDLTLVNSNYFVPGNATVPFQGNLTTSSTGRDPSTASDRTLSAVGAGLALVATGVVGFLLARPGLVPSRPRDEEAELKALIGPYQDAVGETLSLPHKENIVVMRDWIDVVRAADMLGKPILHLKSDVDGRTRHIFYVVDGAIQYVYLHNVLAPETTPPAPPETGLISRLRGPKNP